MRWGDWPWQVSLETRMLGISAIVVNLQFGIFPFQNKMPRADPSTRHTHRIDRLRVRHLRLLDSIHAAGSLTAAAALLRIGQPAATKLLQDLEEAFGHVLVDRGRRGGVLSAAGIRALERLRIAMAALDAVGTTMEGEGRLPLVRIGMLPLAGVTLLPRLVAALSASGALPRIQLRDGPVPEVLALLRAGQIDCVIGRISPEMDEGDRDELDILALNDERFELACRPDHPLVRRRAIELHQLGGASWIVPGRGTYTRTVFDAAFARAGLVPPPAHVECPSFHAGLAMVAASSMLTIAPRSAVELYTSLGRVRKLRLAHPFEADYLAFVTSRSQRCLPAVESIRSTLQHIVA